jgi:hypothetical protein
VALLLKVVYRKFEAVGISIFLHKEVEGNIFASDILYSGILIFCPRKYSEKSKVYHIT